MVRKKDEDLHYLSVMAKLADLTTTQLNTAVEMGLIKAKEVVNPNYSSGPHAKLLSFKEVMSMADYIRKLPKSRTEKLRMMAAAQINKLDGKYRDSYNRFLDELAGNIIKKAIITVTPPTEEWDVRKDRKGKLRFDTDTEQNIYFPLFFYSAIKKAGVLSVILRSFTNLHDSDSKLPIKELRGYVLSLEEGEIDVIPLSAEELFESYGKDASTGKKLPLQPAVIYCGLSEDYLDWRGEKILYK